MKITVLGSGGWGTALALTLLENGHEVCLWSHTREESDRLRTERENPLLKGIPLPETLELTSDLSICKNCEAVVLATPSFAVRATASRLKGLLRPGTVVVVVSKGIEKDSLLLFHDVVEQELGEDIPVVVLSGPSHAEEVARHLPTTVVSASREKACAELVQELFMNEYLRVYTSGDVVGVELGGALKNVIALCAGVCDGMGFGDNTKAALMTRGLTEMARLGVALGGRKETFAGLSGVGDLIVTCTSMHSRNRRAGILIGQGRSAEEAMKEVGAVVEGYYAAATAKALADRVGVELPITEAAYQSLYHGKDARQVLAELMSRSKKHEIEDSWIQ